MDIASRIAGSGGDLGQIQMAMLKTAQDSQASTAAQLVSELPPPPSANPAGVGNLVNVTA